MLKPASTNRPWLLAALIAALSVHSTAFGSYGITQTNANANATGNVGAGALGLGLFNTHPYNSNDSDALIAGAPNGDSVQFAIIANGYDLDANATASGSTSASTPLPAGTTAGSLQAISSSIASGDAFARSILVDANDYRIPTTIAGNYNANHNSGSAATGTQVNTGINQLQTIVMLYAANTLGCSTPAISGDATANCNQTGSAAQANFSDGIDTAGLVADANNPGGAVILAFPFRLGAATSVTAASQAAAVGAASAAAIPPLSGSAEINSLASSAAGAFTWHAPINADPQSLLPDFNGDGNVDEDDIDGLAGAVAALTPPPSATITADPQSVYQGANVRYDIDFDQRVTFDVGSSGTVTSDSDYLIRTALGTEYGDIDLDGDVYIDDFSDFAANYPGVGGWSDGDFDGDGVVGILDFGILAEYYGYGVSGGSSIPEPSSVLVLLSSIACVLISSRT